MFRLIHNLLKKLKKDKRGALTVEATIVLPVFMFAVLSIAFFTKAIYIHNEVQKSLNQSATELSTYSYLLNVTGIMEAHNTTKNELEALDSPVFERSKNITNAIGMMQKSWSEAQKAKDTIFEGKKIETEEFKDIYNNAKTSVEDLKTELAKFKNPKDELIGIVAIAANRGFEFFKTTGGNIIARHIMSKNINKSIFEKINIGAYIVPMDGKSGIDSIDLSQSSYFKDNKTVDLVARYSIKIQLPIGFLPPINIQQRATAKGWLDGDGSYAKLNLKFSGKPDATKSNSTSVELPKDVNIAELSPIEAKNHGITKEAQVEAKKQPPKGSKIADLRQPYCYDGSGNLSDMFTAGIVKSIEDFNKESIELNGNPRFLNCTLFPGTIGTNNAKRFEEANKFAAIHNITILFYEQYSNVEMNILSKLRSTNPKSVLDSIKETKQSGSMISVQTTSGEIAYFLLNRLSAEEKKLLSENCFTGDTLVLTSEGYKRIESIKVGDFVYSEDTKTKLRAYKKVLNVYENTFNDFVNIKVEDDIIKTTPDHLFFVDKGWWKSAKELHKGERLYDSEGELKKVISVDYVSFDKPVKIYNLHVKDFHTYFVSKQKVLVHNDCTEQITDAIRKAEAEAVERAIAKGSTKTWEEFLRANSDRSTEEVSSSYIKLLESQSPWPESFVPTKRVLKPGDTFQMALDSTQPETSPGNFATFDNIPNVNYVREKLAVKSDWKVDCSKIVTYRVKQGVEIPVLEGPVGPQVDIKADKYLSGGGSQIQMLLDKSDNKMKYLEVVLVRSIN